MLTIMLPHNQRAVWDSNDVDVIDLAFDKDPEGFIETAIHLDKYNCPLSIMHLETIMSMFATKIWWSNAEQPSSIWVGKNGEKYFTGYTYSEGDYYTSAVPYVQKINI